MRAGGVCTDFVSPYYGQAVRRSSETGAQQTRSHPGGPPSSTRTLPLSKSASSDAACAGVHGRTCMYRLRHLSPAGTGSRKSHVPCFCIRPTRSESMPLFTSASTGFSSHATRLRASWGVSRPFVTSTIVSSLSIEALSPSDSAFLTKLITRYGMRRFARRMPCLSLSRILRLTAPKPHFPSNRSGNFDYRGYFFTFCHGCFLLGL